MATTFKFSNHSLRYAMTCHDTPLLRHPHSRTDATTRPACSRTSGLNTGRHETMSTAWADGTILRSESPMADK